MELSQPTNQLTQSLFPPVNSDRPPYSYKELIIKAFELVKSKPLELRDIYFLISGIFPYYKPGGAWQSAVRHVLFSDTMFLSDPRTNLWRIISNLESQTLQLLAAQPSLNANIFENQPPDSASSLLMSNSGSSTLNTNFSLYKSSENFSNFPPYTHNSSVHTISSYTTSQPRMSSFETSNRWIDGYPGTSLQEGASWPSPANYRPNFSDSLLKEQSLSAENHRDCRFLSEHNSGHLQPVKPNVRRAFIGSNYDSLNTFTPLSSYPVNTNSNLFLGRRIYEENLVETNSTINKQNEGAFNFYNTQNNSSDCKYSEMRNEESRFNTLRNFSSQKDYGSLSSVNMDFFGNPQNSYSNSFSDSFYPYGYFNIPKAVPYNQISNQLISVNIHAPGTHQTQNHPDFDPTSTSPNSLQSTSSLCNLQENEAIFTNHVVSSLINPKSAVNSSSCQNASCIAQRNANSQCPDNRRNASVSIESPALSSINDFISSLTALSSSINTSQITPESTAPADKRSKTNWESSLININIHLSALENADGFNITGNRDKPASDTQLYDIPSSITSGPTVPKKDNQEISTGYTALHSSVAKECSEDHDMNISELNSVTETTLPDPSDVNASETEFIVNKSNTKGTTCSASVTKDSGDLNLETNKPEMDLTTSEANIICTQLTGCSVNNTNSVCVNSYLNSSEENSVDQDSISSRPLTSNTADVLLAVSCHKPIELNVEQSLETRTCSKSDTTVVLSTESLVTAKTDLPEERYSVSTNYIPVLSTTDSIPMSSITVSIPMSSVTDSIPMSSITDAIPMSSITDSTPMSSITDSIPMSSITDAIPMSSITDSIPMSSITDSIPKSSITDSIPIFSITDSIPMSSITDSIPMSSLTDAIPMSSITDSIPMSSITDSIPMSSITDSIPMSLITDSIPMSSITDSIPISSTANSIPVSSTNNYSKSLNEKSLLPSTPVDVESDRDLELISLETFKLKNKVKQCQVVLERINLPVANLNSNGELLKKNVNTNFISNITSSNNDQESEDFSNLTILQGSNPSLIAEGLQNRLDYSGQAPNQKFAHNRPKNVMPSEINGYCKPSYNYSRLITQALATTPERKATGLQICDMIAKKYPYYEHLTNINWRASIYSALRTRKKFFSIVGTDEQNELLWSFNPTFEQFMLDKWVPKIVRKKLISLSTQNYMPWLSENHPQQLNPPVSSECPVIVSSASASPTTASSGSLSPVIMFSGSLVSASPSGPVVVDCDSSSADPLTSESSEKDPLGPEVSLLDPSPIVHNVSSVEEDFKPWEPEVTVNEDAPNYKTQQPNNLLAIALQGKKLSSTKTLLPTYRSHVSNNDDFSLDNLNVKHVILKEEIMYRVNFNKEHKSVEKFRLHCTVCDDHLGTSGTVCRRKVRLHSLLGVLVCDACYQRTCNADKPNCLWCAKAGGTQIACAYCTNVSFCQSCLERNFGQSWCAMWMGRSDWMCFICDTKQIWPHRAIAYFLFRHYREIRKRKDKMSAYRPVTPKELRFFIQDLSTCCKSVAIRERQPKAIKAVPTSGTPVASVASALPSNFIPPGVTSPALISTYTSPATTPVSSPLFVIREQSPNYIYVQTPSSVPSVTLNTGTQYIHNVYPDKNYVVENKTIENRPATSLNTSKIANRILYTQLPSTAPSFPVTMRKEPAEKNLSPVSEDKSPPLYPFPNTPPPPYPAFEVISIKDSSNETTKISVLNTSNEAKGDFVASKAVENNDRSIIVTSTSEIHGVEPKEPIIIPDIDPLEEVKIQEEKVIAVPMLSARERIERRPMPKSKKQSLLRTVLMSESIESMKRHMQLQSELNISSDNNEISVLSVSPKVGHESSQNMEEPILKSIIETATERLLCLQRNQNVSSSTGNNIEETRPVAADNSSSDTCIDLCENENTSIQAECKIIEPPIATPKIKIKTLRELQDPEVFNVSHNSQENHAQKNEEGDNKPSDITSEQNQVENQELNKNNVTDEAAKINISDLKQGIIEASRTLINTQKQFKELAKIISSNLIYKPDQAIELITKFHDILKACHQELDQIDGNVKHKFGCLITSTIDSVLQLMVKTKEAPGRNAGPVVLKKRRKQNMSFDKEKSRDLIPHENTEHHVGSNAGDFEENQTDSFINNIETARTHVRSSIKRKRDLLDFNPLGKVILGSPDITEEDLRGIPSTWDSSTQGELNQNNSPSHNQVYMEELRRRQYLARKEAWKKKNIWISTKRKKYTKRSLQHNTSSPLMYSEDGSLRKKRTYKKRRKASASDDDDDQTYRPTNYQQYPFRTRRRSCELSRPLRLSARRHPSTVAHVAQLMSFEQRGVTHLIKPCSVVLERLDLKMVQISERSVVEISDTDEVE